MKRLICSAATVLRANTNTRMRLQKIMYPLGLAVALVGLVAGASAPGHAAVLSFSLTDQPAQTNTPYAIPFFAVGSETSISIGGYQVPAFEQTTFNGVFLDSSMTNLLGGTWTFTPAAHGSLSNTFSDGTSVPALNFGGIATGFYDTYSQTIATIPGDEYILKFLFSNDPANSPSGLLVTATTPSVSAVPLPASWTMLLIGFAGLGLFAYRSAKHRPGLGGLAAA